MSTERVAGWRSGERGRGLSLVVMAILGLTLPWGGARGETLDRALVSAYELNPTLLAARAALRAVDETVPQALSNWRPTVTASGDYGRRRVRSTSGFTGFNFSTRETRTEKVLRLNVDQPLFRGFRTLSETREAEHRVRAQRAALMGTEQDVLRDAVTAFMDVVRDQAVLQLNVSNVHVLERQLQATRDRFSVGEVTRTDVAQARARLARAVADRVRAEGALDTSRATYRQVVGEAPGKLAGPKPPKGLPASLDEAIALAGDQFPAVIQAKFVERAARSGVNLVAGELLPTATLSGEVTRSRDTTSVGSTSHQASIFARVTVPLYQSGSVTSRLRQAKQVAGQRRLEVAAARRRAVENATRVWEALQTSRARVRAFTSETKANRIALEGVTEEASAGLRTVLDILDAEQELLDSQVNLVTAKRDRVVAAFEVLRSVGRLTAGDTGLAVKVYDPKRHYEAVRLKLWGLGDSLPAETK